jgi:hypothetical protein
VSLAESSFGLAPESPFLVRREGPALLDNVHQIDENVGVGDDDAARRDRHGALIEE